MCIREVYNNKFVKEKLLPIDLKITNVLRKFKVAIWFFTIVLLGSLKVLLQYNILATYSGLSSSMNLVYMISTNMLLHFTRPGICYPT